MAFQSVWSSGPFAEESASNLSVGLGICVVVLAGELPLPRQRLLGPGDHPLIRQVMNCLRLSAAGLCFLGVPSPGGGVARSYDRAYRRHRRQRTPAGLSCFVWVRCEGRGCFLYPGAGCVTSATDHRDGGAATRRSSLAGIAVRGAQVAVLINHRPAIRSNGASSEVHLRSPCPLFSWPPKPMDDSGSGDVIPSFAPSGCPERTWGLETGLDTGLECFVAVAFTHVIRLCTSHGGPPRTAPGPSSGCHRRRTPHV